MKDKNTNHPVSKNAPTKLQLLEHPGVRWLLMVYDTLVYFLCGVAIFLLHPSLKDPLPGSTSVFYLGIGYVLIFGFRLILRAYTPVWRYASVQSFGRETLATALGSGLLLGLWAILRSTTEFASIPFVTLVSFLAVYMIASILMRIWYEFLYRFADKNTRLARFVRTFLQTCCFVDFDSKTPGAVLKLVLEPSVSTVGPINEVQRIINQFAIRGDVTNITPLNRGYINRTYRVETLSDSGHIHKYTLQRINNKVFPDVDALMDNFKLTTSHLYGSFLLEGHGKKGSVQTLRPTKDGRSYLNDESGCWRVMTYFDDAYSLDIPDKPETFYYAGKSFGRFLKQMSDVDISEIKEVIPNFHNTLSRYMDLEKAIIQNPVDRVKNVAPEIAFIRKHVSLYGMISEALESGRIPTRICHNDCNLNNILFDNETHLPVAIIDLDTVMPSSALYDYGDSMRIGTNTAKDDEKDLSKVSCDLNLYEQYARGYLEACGDILTEEELKLLPYASLIITAEDGIRFLMDYINGDTYYNVFYPGQNLDRARTQLKLVEDMEKKLPRIKQILRKIYAELGLNAQLD